MSEPESPGCVLCGHRVDYHDKQGCAFDCECRARPSQARDPIIATLRSEVSRLREALMQERNEAEAALVLARQALKAYADDDAGLRSQVEALRGALEMLRSRLHAFAAAFFMFESGDARPNFESLGTMAKEAQGWIEAALSSLPQRAPSDLLNCNRVSTKSVGGELPGAGGKEPSE